MEKRKKASTRPHMPVKNAAKTTHAPASIGLSYAGGGFYNTAQIVQEEIASMRRAAKRLKTVEEITDFLKRAKILNEKGELAEDLR